MFLEPVCRKVVFVGEICPLCKQQIVRSQRFFATWGVFLPPSDRLYDYCDGPIHWACFEGWKYRKRFGTAWISFWVDQEKISRRVCKAYLDEYVFVQVSRYPPHQVSLGFFEIGMEYSLELENWFQLLSATSSDLANLSPWEQQTILVSIIALKQSLPTPDGVLAAINWQGKEDLDRHEEAAQQRRVAEQLQKVAPYNAVWKRLADQLSRTGLTCPQCGHHSRDVRLVDKSPAEKSYFRCKACLGSFGPADEKGSQLTGPIIGTVDAFPQYRSK
jgi:hypothetical protein